MDDPEHSRLRRMVAKDFLTRRVQELRPAISDVVEAAARAMTADLVADFALLVPSLVICLMLGVPYEDHALFQSLSRTLLDNTTDPGRAAEAHRELMGYLAGLAEWKRRDPGDDILSRLAVRPDLTARETASLGFVLLITGHESTTNMAALSVLALLRRPGQAARLRAEPALIPGAVEELLRYLTIIHLGLGRAATEDVTVGGAAIRAGDGVICMLSTANRQPELFGPADPNEPNEPTDAPGAGPACPAELDVTPDARRHVAFGHGPHQCLGHTPWRASSFRSCWRPSCASCPACDWRYSRSSSCSNGTPSSTGCGSSPSSGDAASGQLFGLSRIFPSHGEPNGPASRGSRHDRLHTNTGEHGWDSQGKPGRRRSPQR
ncbi:cytochrome P450 [Streptomyces sp. AP-93]|uniref:cytochrome P450 n=1 Tax=Streptomyces sp. AP-93 TaxID=2929048 RepID=UPI001FAFFF4F|nr:cytochrome P450 [Streptomyces sp. AP-93]MCJ0869936.1 cytochrome P450 [Streptomyces sp. AP-93]